MDVRIERATALPLDALAPLLLESEREGWRHLVRLRADWLAGENRFDRPGEGLWLAWRDDALVGVAALNVDPFAADPRVGRLRRLYVAAALRRHGAGRALVEAVSAAAAARFSELHLHTPSEEAAAFFERLGFQPVAGDEHCTHRRALGPW